MYDSDDAAATKVRRFQKLETDRSNFDALWEDVAAVVLPRFRYTFTAGGGPQTKGDKRNQEMYDATAAIAAERFASVVESLITPRNQKWHRLAASDEALNKDREVRLWFDQVTALLFRYRYAPRANFAS